MKNKYKIIWWVLFCLVLVTTTVTIIALCKLIMGEISNQTNRSIILTNNSAGLAFALYNFRFRKLAFPPKDNNVPKYTVYVRAAYKRKSPPSVANPLALPTVGNCFLIFVFPDGKLYEFNVPADYYLALKNGQLGYLTYRIENGFMCLVEFQNGPVTTFN